MSATTADINVATSISRAAQTPTVPAYWSIGCASAIPTPVRRAPSAITANLMTAEIAERRARPRALFALEERRIFSRLRLFSGQLRAITFCRRTTPSIWHLAQRALLEIQIDWMRFDVWHTNEA